MAHPKLPVATRRSLLTAGAASMLLALPLGAAASAQIPAEDEIGEIVTDVIEAVEPVAPEPVATLVEAAVEAAAPVTEVLDAVVEESPAPAPAPSPTGDTTYESAGGAPRRIASPEPAASGETATAPAAEGGPASSLFSRSGLTLQPTLPPVISAPLSVRLPQFAEAFSDAPAVASRAAATPTESGAGLPGWLLATATSVLALLGGAHAVRLYDERWRRNTITTT